MSTFICQKEFSLTVADGTLPCSAWVTAAALEDAFDGFEYSEQITYIPSMNYSVTLGSLPPGLSLSVGGVLSGTPTTVGSYAFTIQATDGQCVLCTKDFTLEVLPQEIDCGWVEEFEDPNGATVPNFYCKDYGTVEKVGILFTAGTLETPGTCPETLDLPTVSGYAQYYLELGPYAAPADFLIILKGTLLVYDGTQCGIPIVADGQITISQTNLVGSASLLLFLTHSAPTEDIGASGVVAYHTGTLPAGDVCRLTVFAQLSNSIVESPSPEASLWLNCKVTQGVPP